MCKGNLLLLIWGPKTKFGGTEDEPNHEPLAFNVRVRGAVHTCFCYKSRLRYEVLFARVYSAQDYNVIMLLMKRYEVNMFSEIRKKKVNKSDIMISTLILFASPWPF